MQLSRNQQVNISFPVTVRYDSLVFFESFYEYYNYIFGELELNMKVSPALLVCCCVDPKYSLANGVETSTFEEQCADNIIIKSNADVYTKRFTQISYIHVYLDTRLLR
jgi:hypothetical protein